MPSFLGAEDLLLLPNFQFLSSKKQFRISDGIFTIGLVGQHLPILGTKAFVEAILLHLLYMLLLLPGYSIWSI